MEKSSNWLFVASIVAWTIMTSAAVIQGEDCCAEFSQLDVYKDPKPFTYTHGNGMTSELVPLKDVVVLFAKSKEEIDAVLIVPSSPKNFVESERYAMVVPRTALKSVSILRQLAKSGKCPCIHVAYEVKAGRAPLLLLPTGLIEVELKDAADADKMTRLAKELNLSEVVEPKNKPGAPPVSPTRKTYELDGKSKYNFVFDVTATIMKADFVAFARPVAPIISRNPAK